VTSREIINFSWKPLHHRNAYLATECPVHSTLEKFELFTVVKMSVLVFCVVMLCGLVGRGMYCLRLQG
jgi:hypothetical protein